MDPQIVKQLDDGLYELNLSVRQTDQTFLDVLGPTAAQIKDALRKENNTAATNQSNINNQLQNTYSKSRDIANKQNQLYKSQLQRRGYEIDQTGKAIKTSDELSISQQSYLDKLDKEIEKENELINATKEPVKKFRELAGATNSLEGFIKILEDKIDKLSQKIDSLFTMTEQILNYLYINQEKSS
jgi:flagellar biosynthesis chaperone FliJ